MCLYFSSCLVRAFAHGVMNRHVDPSCWTQPVLHDWCNKGRGMCYPVCEVYIKDPLLLIEKNSPCRSGSGFPLSLSQWSFILCVYRHIEGNVLFNDALNTFYLRLYGVRHMVNDCSDSEKGNPLPPYRLLFPINSKGSFICTIPQTLNLIFSSR